MSEVRTVYAVASGDYSDKNVWCLFETEDDAKAYMKVWVEAETKRLQKFYGDPEATVSDYQMPYIETYQLWSGVPIAKVKKGGWKVEASAS